jgi:hypothetical protein
VTNDKIIHLMILMSVMTLMTKISVRGKNRIGYTKNKSRHLGKNATCPGSELLSVSHDGRRIWKA